MFADASPESKLVLADFDMCCFFPEDGSPVRALEIRCGKTSPLRRGNCESGWSELLRLFTCRVL